MKYRFRSAIVVVLASVLTASAWAGGDRADTSSESGAPDLINLLEAYREKAEALLAAMDGNAGAAALSADARELAGASVPIVNAFAERHPDCRGYLKAAISVMDRLDTIGHEAIERDYHHDGALPEAPDKCYHVKDLLIHPATVVVLMRESDLEDARPNSKREIAEVLAHLGAVRSGLN